MTSDQLSAAAGIVLSLAFSYLPGLRQWYADKDDETKALLNLGSLVVVGLFAFGVSCAGIQSVVPCTQPGAWAIVQAIFWAAVGNMTTHGITKRIAPVTK